MGRSVWIQVVLFRGAGRRYYNFKFDGKPLDLPTQTCQPEIENASQLFFVFVKKGIFEESSKSAINRNEGKGLLVNDKKQSSVKFERMYAGIRCLGLAGFQEASSWLRAYIIR